MNQEQLIALAREAGLAELHEPVQAIERLERFAALVAEAELKKVKPLLQHHRNCQYQSIAQDISECTCGIGNYILGDKCMKGFYFEKQQPHILVWPVIACSNGGEFWVGVGWLNFEFGWRKGEYK